MRRIFAAMIVLCAITASAAAQEIVGSGSTFCYPAMVKLVEAYAKVSGTRVLFQPTGSAAGMLDIQHQVVDFATHVFRREMLVEQGVISSASRHCRHCT